MSDLHIDDFYRDAAKALVALYSQFPRRTILYVEDISGPDSPDEFGLHSTRHQACFETLLWLAHSGFLRYEQLVRQEAIDQAVLTHRGFLTLSHPYAPVTDDAALQATPSLVIHQLRRELNNGSSLSLAGIMQGVMLISQQHQERSS